MSVLTALRPVLYRNPLTARILDTLRPLYRSLRTRWLRLRYPHGGFVTCVGTRIYCDFSRPEYTWYDADSPNHVFDRAVIADLVRQSEGNVFIDVGAHYGLYAAFLAQEAVRKTARPRVIAFEPDPNGFQCLERTMSQLSASADVTPLRMALGDRDGEINLYRGGAVCAHTYAEKNSIVAGTAPMRRLDNVLQDLLADGDRLAVIKIDIDGAEESFLRGAKDRLERDSPLLFMEFCPAALRAAGTDPPSFLAQLCHDFQTYWVVYEQARVRRVTAAAYDEIAAFAGDRVTDLVLAKRSLVFSQFS